MTSWIRQRDTLKGLADRETDLLNQRTNVLLVYNSILMAGLALAGGALSIRLILGISGLLSTLIWLYVGKRGADLGEFTWDKVLETESKISNSVPHSLTEFVEHRKQTRRARLNPFGWPVEVDP